MKQGDNLSILEWLNNLFKGGKWPPFHYLFDTRPGVAKRAFICLRDTGWGTALSSIGKGGILYFQKAAASAYRQSFLLG